MKKEIIKTLYKEFVFGGHFQSLGASGIVVASFIILGEKLIWPPVVLAYLIFYPLYLFNRLWEIDQDAVSNPERTKYFRSYLKWMPMIFVLESAFTISLLIIFSPNTLIIVYGLLLYVLGLMYTIAVKKVTVVVFAFKNIYVAGFFAGLVPFSVLFVGGDLDLAVWILTGFIFLKGILMQILLDIKDIKSDLQEKLKTIADKFGKDLALKISLVLIMILGLIAPVYLVLGEPIFKIEFLFSLFSFLFYIYIIHLIKKENLGGYILVSGEYLFWAIFIVIGKIII